MAELRGGVWVIQGAAPKRASERRTISTRASQPGVYALARSQPVPTMLERASSKPAAPVRKR